MKAVNFFKTWFCTALALAVVTGCSDDDNNGGSGTPSITVGGKQTTAVAVKLEGGTTSPVTIESTGDWTLTFSDAAQTWCTASKTSGGRGTSQVTFTVEESTVEREITAKVTTYGTIAGVASVPVYAEIVIKQNVDGSADVKTNVSEIRALLKAMNPTNSSVDVTAEIAALTLTAIVGSDGAGNNLANQYQIAVQDAGTNPNSGLMVNATLFNTTKVVPGQVLVATLTKAKVQLKNGAVQLGLSDDEITLTAGDAPEPVVITPDQLAEYEAQFVRIDNCQPVSDFVGKAWNSGNNGNKGSVTFETLGEASASFVVYSSSYASFKENIVPEKSGYIQGISSCYNETRQLAPRTAADFAGLTGEYKGPEYQTGTISQIVADEYWEVTAAIAATYTKGFLLADDSGYALVFNNAWNSQTDNTYTVGQKVTVKGKVAAFNGLLQFSSPEITAAGEESFDPGQAADFDAAALTAYVSDLKYQYVTLSGALNIKDMTSSTSGAYKSYTVAVPGFSAKTVTLAYAFDKDFADLASGDVVDVTGYAIGTNQAQDAINIMLTTVAKNTTTPAITISTVAQNFAAAGGEQTFDFVAVNAGENKVFAKITGTDAAQFTVPAEEITGTSVTVTALENTDAAVKTAALEVFLATAADATPVASATVALKQDAPTSSNGYALVTKVADLKEGLCYMAGLVGGKYQTWTGTITSSQCETVPYTWTAADGSFVADDADAADAAQVQLIKVSGVDNAYYIKYGDNYLTVGAAGKNQLKLVADAGDNNYWTFSDDTDGVKASAKAFDSNMMTSTSASSKHIRSYATSTTTGVAGICFFFAK